MNKISVIIPVYNEEKNIVLTLLRLWEVICSLPQYSFEIIVVDGGSTDQTAVAVERLRPLLPLRLLRSASGRGIQLATGAEAADGDLLVFLHADTVIGADYFVQAVMAIGRQRPWGCARLRFINDKDEPEKGIFRIMEFFANYRVTRSSIAFGDQSIFCSREFYERHGGYRRDFCFFEDYRFSQDARKLCRPLMLRALSSTSSRRHRRYGIYKTIWHMQKTRWLYMRGTPIDRLWEYYKK